MSVHFTSPIWKYSRRRGTELLALLALGDMANDEGICWPSMVSIAKRIKLDEKQARRIVHDLIEGGEVKILVIGGGSGHSNRYRLNLEAICGTKKTLPSEGEIKLETLPRRGDLVIPNPPTPAPKPSLTADKNPPLAAGEESSLTVKEPSTKKEGVEAAPRPAASPVASGSAVPFGFEDPEWEEDADLRRFLLTQPLVKIPLEYFSDNGWWTRASIGCNGITVAFLKRTFAALGNHFAKKPQTRPMTKGGWQQKMTNFLYKEREIVNREIAKTEQLKNAEPRRAYAR